LAVSGQSSALFAVDGALAGAFAAGFFAGAALAAGGRGAADGKGETAARVGAEGVGR
jgi:hypothetical protein